MGIHECCLLFQYCKCSKHSDGISPDHEHECGNYHDTMNYMKSSSTARGEKNETYTLKMFVIS